MTRMYFQYHHRCTDVTDVCTMLPVHHFQCTDVRRVGKRIIFTLAIIFILQSKAFTQFEMHLTVPIGATLLYPYTEGTKFMQTKPYFINYRSPDDDTTSYNVGVLMQVGHRFDLKYETGVTSISLLADIGYFQELIGMIYTYGISGEDYVYVESTKFQTLNLGIIPKVNLYFPKMKIPLSIGFGGGVKIPLSGTRYLLKNSGEEIIEDLSYQDIKEIFLHPFMPYVKLTVDTYYYVSDSIALTIGLYGSYNFGMKYDIEKLNAEGSSEDFPLQPLELTEYGYSSFDIGLTFGISFGRPNPKLKK